MSGEVKSCFGAYNQQTTESRIKLVFPDLLARLRVQKPRRLLDYGCGPGFFLRDHASALNIDQVGYDVCDEMIQTATTNCKDVPKTTIVPNLEVLEPASFGAVTTTAVWMCWKSEPECLENLGWIRRLISFHGVLYAAVTHPCFRDQAYSTFSMHLDQGRYLEAGTPYEARLFDQGQKVSFTDHHWPLWAMSAQLKRAGFRIEEIQEYPDTAPGSKGSPWMLIVATPK
jgi:trans-aconitate methyltransferase